MPSRLMKTYQKLLDTHFVYVQCVQTSLLMGTGDVISQTFVEKHDWKRYDGIRTLRFAALGSVLVGPAVTTWFKLLSKHIGNNSKPSVVVKKVVADQLLFAPTFMPIFLTALNLLSGHGIPYIKKEIGDKYIDILLTNYKVWPAVQLFNFAVMPLKYQVVLSQFVGIFWNTYLSWKSHQKV